MFRAVLAAPKALTVVLTVLNTVAVAGPTIAAPSVVAPVTPSVVLNVPDVPATGDVPYAKMFAGVML
jgi:hypothetical protein